MCIKKVLFYPVIFGILQMFFIVETAMADFPEAIEDQMKSKSSSAYEKEVSIQKMSKKVRSTQEIVRNIERMQQRVKMMVARRDEGIQRIRVRADEGIQRIRVRAAERIQMIRVGANEKIQMIRANIGERMQALNKAMSVPPHLRDQDWQERVTELTRTISTMNQEAKSIQETANKEVRSIQGMANKEIQSIRKNVNRNIKNVRKRMNSEIQRLRSAIKAEMLFVPFRIRKACGDTPTITQIQV